ncbi:capsular polysaccharide export protein [Rheinheimera soli]|uniref:Capsular polysaccharide export protein n=1 Tax=Rheinheimera soli TaxID=443616 RepID=A0ABU1VU81_9GAMM|nr:capsular polysaccharide export protein [Rheinheimera soli]
MEDGFLRSVLLGSESPPYSVVLDDVGIYYDASAASRLENLIKQPLTQQQQQRAKQLIQYWQKLKLSKYNHSPEAVVPTDEPYVLVVDQTFGDASIRHGLANEISFHTMFSQARECYPQHKIVLKIHPDVFAGKKKGHFDQLTQQERRNILILADDVHPVNLLQKADAVFCVTSQMGFEALLWQKPVHCFGMPFYAGWGLTTDSLTAPERRCQVSIEQLVYAALVSYPRYIDPETCELCDVEQLMAWIGLQRQQRNRFTMPLYLDKPPHWKKSIFQHFLQGARVTTIENTQLLPEGARKIVWGAHNDENLIRVEDGFIRSVGLGADLTRPLSWVFDPVGIYYDASRPSRLEQLLQAHDFTKEECDRAEQLIFRLIALKLTKYNVGQSNWQRPPAQQIILVPGQVESDASIRLGSPVLKTNLELLQAVRISNPDAYILYKPHPDVQAGLRVAGQADHDASAYCNETLGNEDMAHLLTKVDEVHTLTSLTGFEALIRGIPVVCYGQPFYSGWGLTKDIYPVARRIRHLTVNQLVAATLLLYPTYINWRTGCYTSAENAVTELEYLKAKYTGVSLWQKFFRKILALKRF